MLGKAFDSPAALPVELASDSVESPVERGPLAEAVLPPLMLCSVDVRANAESSLPPLPPPPPLMTTGAKRLRKKSSISESCRPFAPPLILLDVDLGVLLAVLVDPVLPPLLPTLDLRLRCAYFP